MKNWDSVIGSVFSNSQVSSRELEEKKKSQNPLKKALAPHQALEQPQPSICRSGHEYRTRSEHEYLTNSYIDLFKCHVKMAESIMRSNQSQTESVIKAKMKYMTENSKLLQLFKKGESQGKEFKQDHSRIFQNDNVEKVEARREQITELKKKGKFNPSILKDLQKLSNQEDCTPENIRTLAWKFAKQHNVVYSTTKAKLDKIQLQKLKHQQQSQQLEQ